MIVPDHVFDPVKLLIAPIELYPSPLIVIGSTTVKLFPTSFQSLTTPTKYGPRAVYINSAGSVNTSLQTQLPPYVISSLV